MQYQISRNGQMYGPYTLEDLHRYVASGHVLLTDLARSTEEGVQTAAEWRPVSELLGASASTSPAFGDPAPTGYASSGGYPPAGYSAAPNALAPADGPPNLHWGLVLLFDVLTCSLFQMVWNIILAAWFKRVAPGSKALLFYIASTVLLIIQGIMGQAAGVMAGRHGYTYGSHIGVHTGGYAVYGLVASICWIVRLVTRFIFRNELEQHFNSTDPIGLRLNPVLTFFFGGLYFQSQMNRINDIKRGLRFR